MAQFNKYKTALPSLPSDLQLTPPNLIAVVGRLEGSLHWHSDVVRLLLGERGELHAQRLQVQTGHLLVQVLGQDVHLPLLVFVGRPVAPQLDLSQGLVGEGRGHHEGRMARGAPQVQQTALRQHDDAVAVREDEAIHLNDNNIRQVNKRRSRREEGKRAPSLG